MHKNEVVAEMVIIKILLHFKAVEVFEFCSSPVIPR